MQLTEDMTSSNPDLNPILSRNSAMTLAGGLGLHKILDLYATAMSNGPNMVGLKLQILGNPAPGAKAGNFSVALAGGGAFSSSSNYYESDGVRGDADTSFSGWEAMLLMGYRTNENFLIYAGPFQSHFKTETVIKRKSGTSVNVTGEPNGTGDFTGGSVGVRLGNSIYVALEGTYTSAKWTREKPTELKANDLNSWVGGIAFGGAW